MDKIVEKKHVNVPVEDAHFAELERCSYEVSVAKNLIGFFVNLSKEQDAGEMLDTYITVGGQVMLACCDVCRCFGEQFSLDSCRREDVKQYVYFDAPRGRNGVAKKTIFAPARLLIGYIRTRYPRKNTEIVRWIQTEIVPAMSYEQKQETEVAEKAPESNKPRALLMSYIEQARLILNLLEEQAKMV